MNVHFSTTGDVRASFTCTMDSIPREGEIVELPGVGPEQSFVRRVTWYPLGDPDGSPEQFVYVVVGPRRPYP